MDCVQQWQKKVAPLRNALAAYRGLLFGTIRRGLRRPSATQRVPERRQSLIVHARSECPR